MKDTGEKKSSNNALLFTVYLYSRRCGAPSVALCLAAFLVWTKFSRKCIYTVYFSDPGYPYDNACIESVHSLIKREWLNRIKIRWFSHAQKLAFEYIEDFYNTIRIHSHCNYLSPDDFENLFHHSLSVNSCLIS